MQRGENKAIIKKFINNYCDAIYCSLGEFISINEEIYQKIKSKLSTEEMSLVLEYAVLKNKLSGVGYLNIKTPVCGLGVSALNKHNLQGNEIIDAKDYNTLPTKAFIGEKIIFEVENLLDYNEFLLSQLADFSAKLHMPMLFKVGQDLEEVGKIVNMYKCSPIELIESFGFLDRKCYLLGLNFIDKDDQKLIKQYDGKCIFCPRSDGEEGKGAINLYNFIYNDIKFGFSSGKCYNIDMLGECKLAKINTNNLMYDNSLIDDEILLNALCEDNNQEENNNKINDKKEEFLLEIELDYEEPIKNIFDKKVSFKSEQLKSLQQKIKEIAKNLKEKI